jgi:glycosyltransferase involved in cell wall biosynthesis
MKEPLISLIIPFFNTEKYFQECLVSVIRQTYRNLEIILVDDGSTDNSLRIAEGFVKNDSRIKIVKQGNKGQAIARRNAFNKSSGEYVCFVDSDDFVSPEYVDKLYEALLKEKTDISVCCITMFDDKRKITEAIKKDTNKVYSEGNLIRQFVEHYDIESPPSYIMQSMNTKLYKRRLLENLDYDMLKTNVFEDNYMSVQILKKAKGDRIAIVEKTLYYYRIADESTMTSSEETMIKIGDREISYPELFEEVVRYIGTIYASTPDVDSYLNKLRSNIYYRIAKDKTQSGIAKDILLRAKDSELIRLNSELKSFLEIKRSLRLLVGNVRRKIAEGGGYEKNY